MYKVFLQFPEALRPAFPRLKEKLEDPDPGESHTPWLHMTHVHKADTQTQTWTWLNQNSFNVLSIFCEHYLFDFEFESYLSEKKGKSQGIIACMGKIAAWVLLKLFINGNERCYTTGAP